MERKNIRDIGDLVALSKYPEADIPAILESAYIRGIIEGKNLAKEKIIEAIKEEK